MLPEVSTLELAAVGAQAVTFVWIALEVTWLAAAHAGARAALLRRARTAAAMALGAVVFGVAYTAALRVAWQFVAAGAPSALVGFWREHTALAVVAAFIAWDGVGFVYHWLGHHTGVGWAGHRPHHTGDVFDITLALRQTWMPVHAFACQPFLALAGFDFGVIVACAAASNLWQALEHSSALPELPRWWRAAVMTPSAHRHHHSSDQDQAVNLGPVFTLWDRLAGTWRATAEPAPVSYGVTSAGGVLAIELAGWRALLQRAD